MYQDTNTSKSTNQLEKYFLFVLAFFVALFSFYFFQIMITIVILDVYSQKAVFATTLKRCPFLTPAAALFKTFSLLCAFIVFAYNNTVSRNRNKVMIFEFSVLAE